MHVFRAWTLSLLCLFAGLSGVACADQNVVVVLDDSGSMQDRMRSAGRMVRRMDAAKKALLEVLDNLPPDTNVGVLALNSRVDGSNWIVPLGDADRQRWQANIGSIRADGGTPLGEFMGTAVDQLLAVREQQVYGTYRLLVVTDGEANDERLLETLLPQILARGIVVDVIGVDMESEHSLATRVHSYRRADDDASLKQAISEVFAETSADDQNAEADFELIAGLPDGFAEAALQSLAKVRNEPVDRKAPPVAASRGSTSGGSTAGSPANTVANGVRTTALGGLICCFGTFLVVGVVIVKLISGRRPPRR